MKLTIKYVCDGEMNTEDRNFYLENVLEHICTEGYTLEGPELIHVHNVDLVDFTKCFLKLSQWDDDTVNVNQLGLLELIHLSQNPEEICLGFWMIFNGIGAETYTWCKEE